MRVLSATSTIYLHVKQTEGTETANVSFDLGAATMTYGNNATYFEWGRKDPMQPSNGLTNVGKPIYGTYSTIIDINTADIAATIRTPHYFNVSTGSPSLELWNVGNTATTVNINPVIKSIYDPSPIGFHIPCLGAFQGWDESGRSYWQNTIGKQGRYFYQLGPTTGNPIFFPALGYRLGAASLSHVDVWSWYWSNCPSSSTYAYDLHINGGSINTQNNDIHVYGFSVRPVAE